MTHRRPRVSRLLALGLAGALVSCGGTAAPSTPVETAPARPLDRAKISYASMLLRGRDIAPDEWRTWQAEQTPVSAIVDSLLADPFVSEVVAPRLLFKHYFYRLGGAVLADTYKLKEADGALYLIAPCRPSKRTMIRPWWDLSKTVQVCSDSIRADVWETKKADGRVLACSAVHASPAHDPASTCGCGPNLIRCFPADLPARFLPALKEEVRATIAHAVASDQPLGELFLGNSTVRTRDVELIYLKSVAEAQRLADPVALLSATASWPETGKLAPRVELEPGQHAGLITAPHVQYTTSDLRQRMRIIYELLWCAEVTAPGALPEHLLALRTHDLASASDELAARPICTTCHARLDSAMKFFSGYPNPLTGSWQFVPGAYGGRRGPLYGNDIGDPRGVGPLNAHGFAELAVRQPEFTRCMARNAVEYVFGSGTPPELVNQLAKTAVPTKITFRQLIRSSLLELIACQTCSVPSIATSAGPSAGTERPRLAELVDEHCTACHFDGASIPSLEGALDQKWVTRLLAEVMSGRMPPTGALPVATKMRFLTAASRELPDGVFSSTGEFLRAHADPPGALPLFVVREYAHQSIDRSSHAGPVNAVENAVDGREAYFTLTYATLTAIEAYRSCGDRAVGSPASRNDCTGALLDRVWNASLAR